MSSRSKVSAAIRKFFKSSDKKDKDKVKEDDAHQPNQPHPPPPHQNLNAHRPVVEANKNSTDSPARRLRRVAPTSTNVVSMSAGTPAIKPIDSTIRAKRLMKELKEIQKLQHSRTEPIFKVELINDNLYEWHAKLFRIDPDSPLAEDLAELNIPHILLHLVFPENFPFAPPFMRVAEPRIEKGFVMEGGAICMELLTPRGWASAYTVEAVIMQFAASVVKGHGRVSRKPKGSKDFSRKSAEEAFRSLVKTHDKYGWVTPSLSDG